MAYNPNYERLIEIEKAIMDAYTLIDPTRFFDLIPLKSGERILRRKFAQMPMVPQATKDIGIMAMDKFRSENGEFRAPANRLDIVLEEADYKALLASGDYADFARNAAKSLAAAVAKTLFQNVLRVTATGEVLYWGMADVGSGTGTYNRPLDSDVTTKVTGSWTATSAIAAQSAAALKGRITQHDYFNDGTPFVMFYDAIMETVFEAREPGMTVPTDIRDIFKPKFPRGMIPIPKADDGTSIITGATPTATSFATIACNPRFFNWMADDPPSAKLEPRAHQQGAILTLIHNGGLEPIAVKDLDGNIYKASQAMLLQGT